jgi:hypothetical protein
MLCALHDNVLWGIERSSKDVEIVHFNVCDGVDCGGLYTTCNGCAWEGTC